MKKLYGKTLKEGDLIRRYADEKIACFEDIILAKSDLKERL